MIIHIDNSILESLNNPTTTEDAIAFIEDICKLRRTGKVIIDIKKKVALKVQENTQLSSLNKRIMALISQEVTYNRVLFNKYTQSLFCYSSNYIDRNIPIEEAHSFDISNYINTGLELNVPKLILEDIEDAIVYSVIAEWKIKQCTDLKGFKVQFSAVHGGGNRTANVCKREYEAGNLIYSICDSDKKTPECDIGDTAKLTNNFFIKNKILKNFYVIDAHEVENLIPIDTLLNIARREQKPAIEFIKSAMESNTSCGLYYDLKNGFKFNVIYSGSCPISQYWKPIYESSRDIELFKNKISTGQQTESSVIYNGLSSMLPHAINEMKSFDIDIIFKNNALKEEWDKIGHQLISWFISSAAISN